MVLEDSQRWLQTQADKELSIKYITEKGHVRLTSSPAACRTDGLKQLGDLLKLASL